MYVMIMEKLLGKIPLQNVSAVLAVFREDALLLLIAATKFVLN